MHKNRLTLTLATGLATFIASVWSAEHRTKIPKTDVSRWEGEGGNVPEVPTVRPQVSPPLNPAGRIPPG